METNALLPPSHWVCRSGSGIVRGARFSNDKLNGTEGVRHKECSLKRVLGCLQSAECRKGISNGQLEQALMFLQSAFPDLLHYRSAERHCVSIPSVTTNHGPLVYLSLHCLFFLARKWGTLHCVYIQLDLLFWGPMKMRSSWVPGHLSTTS